VQVEETLSESWMRRTKDKVLDFMRDANPDVRRCRGRELRCDDVSWVCVRVRVHVYMRSYWAWPCFVIVSWTCSEMHARASLPIGLDGGSNNNRQRQQPLLDSLAILTTPPVPCVCVCVRASRA
jgi:hypothetical protein